MSTIGQPERATQDRESHHFCGKRYLHRMIEKNAASEVIYLHNKIILQVRPETSTERKEAILEICLNHRTIDVFSP